MPLAGRDVISSQRTSLQTLFQSTRPSRGATRYQAGEDPVPQISIHAPLAGRDALVLNGALVEHRISIHAPREGRDPNWRYNKKDLRISIHAPREGRD